MCSLKRSRETDSRRGKLLLRKKRRRSCRGGRTCALFLCAIVFIERVAAFRAEFRRMRRVGGLPAALVAAIDRRAAFRAEPAGGRRAAGTFPACRQAAQTVSASPCATERNCRVCKSARPISSWTRVLARRISFSRVVSCTSRPCCLSRRFMACRRRLSFSSSCRRRASSVMFMPVIW